MEDWIAEGFYLDWNCEEESHPARPKSPHSENRICSNDLLSNTDDDEEFPVGAATVKELYKSGKINGYAVMVHTQEGDTAKSWYYYEILGSNVVASSNGASSCDGCHSVAGKDGADGHHRIFTIVK